jgi:endonuclease/exonuclease/phosphatase family metal-dependent hydrolase
VEPLLVRSWNLFHGNAVPTERHDFLEEMVRLAATDRPDILCLQEVPPWALDRLAEWSGMQVFGDVAHRPTIGPFPSTATIGRLLTSFNHGLIRSFLAGQANAVLLKKVLRAEERHVCVLNPSSFRRTQARRLRIEALGRMAWGRERRISQTLRVALPDGRRIVVANLHATNFWRDTRLPDAEILRAASFADGLARADEAVLLCGDFNATAGRSRTLLELAKPDWGFSPPTRRGIDHILVRGLRLAEGPSRWPNERRTLDGRLLSDHAPVDVRVE